MIWRVPSSSCHCNFPHSDGLQPGAFGFFFFFTETEMKLDLTTSLCLKIKSNLVKIRDQLWNSFWNNVFISFVCFFILDGQLTCYGAYGCQRTTFACQFPPPTRWILGMNLGWQAWWLMSLPIQPSHWPLKTSFCMCIRTVIFYYVLLH